MRIEVTGDLGAERCGAIVARLASVLADVRAAVEDWPAMRALVQTIAAEVARSPHFLAAVGATDPAEDAAFVAWLDRDNFLFLGTREYVFHGEELDIVPGIDAACCATTTCWCSTDCAPSPAPRPTCRRFCAPRN